MSSIPLPALHIAPSEAPNPLAQVGQLLSVRSLLNQQQGQQMQLQQQQLDMEDQQKFRQAFQQAGGDPDKTVQMATQMGVGPRTLTPYVAGVAEYKKKIADATKAQQEVYANQADLLAGAHQTVDAAPPEQKPAVYQAQLAGLKNAGVDISKFPAQYPGDEQFAMIGPAIQGNKILTEQALKESQAKKAAADVQETLAKIPGEKAKSEQAQKVNAGTSDTGITADQQATLAQGKQRIGIEAQNAATSRGRLAEEQRHNRATEGALTPEALDMASDVFAKTGKMSDIAGRSTAQRTAIINRAAEKNAQLDPVKNAAEFEANKKALDALQKQFDSTSAFEETAGKNLDQFLSSAKKIIDTGSPALNAPIRMISKNVFGSQAQAVADAARQVAINEIAKVTGSPGMTGQLSDSARHEVEAFNPQNATLKQTIAVAQTLRQDMTNRRQSYADRIEAIKARLNSRGNATAQPGTTGGPAVGAIEGGYKFKGGNPADQNNWEKQ